MPEVKFIDLTRETVFSLLFIYYTSVSIHGSFNSFYGIHPVSGMLRTSVGPWTGGWGPLEYTTTSPGFKHSLHQEILNAYFLTQ